jgi:TATA-binding protein-associated factor Taf7
VWEPSVVKLATIYDDSRSVQDVPQAEVQLHMRTEHIGALTIRLPGEDARIFAVSLHETPTLIETFKSHNHVNLVKSADIGQILMVHSALDGDPEMLETSVNALIEMEKSDTLPCEVPRGLTPPMSAGCGRVRLHSCAGSMSTYARVRVCTPWGLH